MRALWLGALLLLVLVAVDGQKLISGRFGKVHGDDFPANNVSKRFYVETGDKRIFLSEPSDSYDKEDFMDLVMGEEVEVLVTEDSADSDSNKVLRFAPLDEGAPMTEDENGTEITNLKRSPSGIPIFSLNAKGEMNVLYIMLSWPEYSYDLANWGPSRILSEHVWQIQNEYRSFSYGQINIVTRNVQTGASPAAVGPYRLLTSAANCDNNLDAAMASAKAAGVPLDKYDAYVMLFPSAGSGRLCNSGFAWGGTDSTGRAVVWNWLLSGGGFYVNRHELGHGLKVGHATYQGLEYGEQCSVMGGCSYFHNAPHMDLFGWFDSDMRTRIGAPQPAKDYILRRLGEQSMSSLRTITIGDHTKGLHMYAGQFYVSYRASVPGHDDASYDWRGVHIHEWLDSTRTRLITILKSPGQSIRLDLKGDAYSDVTLVNHDGVNAWVRVSYVGCASPAALGFNCGFANLPGCQDVRYAGTCAKGSYCSPTNKCRRDVPPAPPAGAAVYYPFPRPLRLFTSDESRGCVHGRGIEPNVPERYIWFMCSDKGGMVRIPSKAIAIEAIVQSKAPSLQNQFFRVSTTARTVIPFAETRMYGEKGKPSSAQFLLPLNSMFFTLLTNGTDTAQIDVLGYWAPPAAENSIGYTKGLGFVPFRQPRRIFSTVSKDSPVAGTFSLGRKLKKDEQISISLDRANLPDRTVAIFGVTHAIDSDSGAKLSLFSGPRERGPSGSAMHSYRTGKFVSDSFSAQVVDDVVNLYNGDGNPHIHVDAFGVFTMTKDALGMKLQEPPVLIYDSRTVGMLVGKKPLTISVKGKVPLAAQAVSIVVTAFGAADGRRALISVSPVENNGSTLLMAAEGNNDWVVGSVHVGVTAAKTFVIESSTPVHVIIYCSAYFVQAYRGGDFTLVMRADAAPADDTSKKNTAVIVAIVGCVAIVAIAVLIATVIVILRRTRRTASANYSSMMGGQ